MKRFLTPLAHALRRPRWIALALTTLILMSVFISLGVWQLDRLEQRREANALISSARSGQVHAASDLFSPDSPLADEDEYTRVTLTGEYDTENEILVRNRSVEERPGFFVLTPLVAPNAHTVMVARGWIPLSPEGADTPPPVPQAPAGEVRVTGRARTSENHDAEIVQIGPYTAVRAINMETLQQNITDQLSLGYVVLTEHTRPDGSSIQEDGAPRLIPQQPLDEGPHLSYAIQWFSFSVIALGGCVLLLYRAGRSEEERYASNTQNVPSQEPRSDVQRSQV